MPAATIGALLQRLHRLSADGRPVGRRMAFRRFFSGNNKMTDYLPKLTALHALFERGERVNDQPVCHDGQRLVY